MTASYTTECVDCILHGPDMKCSHPDADGRITLYPRGTHWPDWCPLRVAHHEVWLDPHPDEPIKLRVLRSVEERLTRICGECNSERGSLVHILECGKDA